MIHQPTRRDVFRYGGAALLTAKLRAQSVAFPGPGLGKFGGAPITFINGASAGGLNSATTPAMDSTAANFAIIAVALFNNTSGGVITDTAVNSWIPLTNQQSIGTNLQFWYAANISTSAVHTFTCTQAGAAPGIVVGLFNHVATAILPFDVESGSGTNSPGSITPTQNNEVVFGGCAQGQQTGDPTTCTGFTTIAIINAISGVNMGCALAYLIQTAATAENPTWNATGSPRATKSACFFKHP